MKWSPPEYRDMPYSFEVTMTMPITIPNKIKN